MIRPNPVKARLAAGRKCFGMWLVANNALTAELAATIGFDFVIVDHEHGPGDLMGLTGQLQALRSGGGENAPAALVRVPWNDMVYIKRVLDCGAEGIMVPYVETAEQARAAVAACKYPPAGVRGCAVGHVRATGYGLHREEYWETVNDRVLTVIQIETESAIDNVSEIAAVEGVDMLFVGPTDLTVSAGMAPGAQSYDAAALLTRAEERIRATGKPMATVPYFGLGPAAMYEKGYDMLVQGTELTLMRNGAKALLETHREAVGDTG